MASQHVPSEDTKEEFLEELGLVGRIPSCHCIGFPQFSYDIYIPRQYRQLEQLPLVVLVHGSGRNAYALRESFTGMAESRGCALLCPLFPAGLGDPYETENYKMIKHQGIRYDEVLLSMVDDVKTRYPRVANKQFLLWGFSGGGQFVHRFAYLHPGRLMGLAVGAPGTVTLLDDETDFPDGTANLSSIFGVKLDLPTLKTAPILFIAGDRDTDSFHAIARGRPVPSNYEGRLGKTARLQKSWFAACVPCQFQKVAGAAHEEEKMLPFVMKFFEKILGNRPVDMKPLL